MKLNLGCGGNKIAGWENHDADVDITKRLPWADGSASHILAEHVVEHIDSAGAWSFFNECHRLLKQGGVLRVIVPSVTRMTHNYALGHGGGALTSAEKEHIRAIMCDHGHKTVWNAHMLYAALQTVGFSVEIVRPDRSKHVALNGVDGHGKSIGVDRNNFESEGVEATKS